MKNLSIWLLFTFLLLVTGIPAAAFGEDETTETEAEICARLVEVDAIAKALQTELGFPQSCVREDYSVEAWGTYQTVVYDWTGVKLRIEFQPSESSIYVIKASGSHSLNADWFARVRDEIIAPNYNVDWSHDAFPGPSGEHYETQEDGTNAQVWIERNKENDITWLRFSYAL